MKNVQNRMSMTNQAENCKCQNGRKPLRGQEARILPPLHAGTQIEVDTNSETLYPRVGPSQIFETHIFFWTCLCYVMTFACTMSARGGEGGEPVEISFRKACPEERAQAPVWHNSVSKLIISNKNARKFWKSSRISPPGTITNASYWTPQYR